MVRIMQARSSIQPKGPALLTEVRVGLLRKGTSLAAWARENNITRQWVTDALLGRRDGPAAIALRERLIRESGATS